MAKTKPYKVSTLPKKKINRFNVFGAFGRNQKRKQLVFSVIGVYILIGGLVGTILFNTSSNQAQASQSALISASLKISEEKVYQLGETIDLSLTLQNTSVNESINTISVDLLSTRDSISWTRVHNNENNLAQIFIDENDTFELPTLSAGERIQYEITGIVQDNRLDYVNVVANLKYINREGVQETRTNRVYTELNIKNQESSNLFELNPSQENYFPGEIPTFTLTRSNIQPSSGTIYVTDVNSDKSVSSIDCDLSENIACQVDTESLPVSEYTAIYIDENKNYFSNIAFFSVVGEKSEFTPNGQVSLTLPLGGSSVNGVVPVLAEKVVSLNSKITSESICRFEISQNEEVLDTVDVLVDNDRNCRTTIPSEKFTNGGGVYTISLANTDLKQEISFINKLPDLIQLQVDSEFIEKGKSVSIFAENITNTLIPEVVEEETESIGEVINREIVEEVNSEEDETENENLESEENESIETENTEETTTETVETVQEEVEDIQNATIGILYPFAGEYTELNRIDGERLVIEDGEFAATIPGFNLSEGGLYQIILFTEDGQQSDWLTLDFSDKQVAFSSSGVLYDANSLKVNQNINLSLDGLLDRNGNLVEDGECTADIFLTNSSEAIRNNGQISNGICNVSVASGQIQTAGPALVTFTSRDINNKINQSKHIEILPGSATDYGFLNMEFLPMKKDYANSLIIGPVTDLYGNLTSSYNNILEIKNGSNILELNENFNIENGFSQITIPSGYAQSDTIEITLKNSNEEIILNRVFRILEEETPLVLPIFPSTVSSKENIVVSLDNLMVEEVEECSLSLIKSTNQTAEEISEYTPETASCTFDWNLNKFRSAESALLQLELGSNVFTQVISQTPSEANNIFEIRPQIRVTPLNELQIKLLTSPIVDKQGTPVQEGTLTWRYNGKLESTPIVNGLSQLNLPASKLDTKDIQVTLASRNLDVDLDVQASITSISQTSNVSIFIGNYDIDNTENTFEILQSSSQISENVDQIFKFRTDTCSAKIVNTLRDGIGLNTQMLGGICYVQAPAYPGENTITIEDNGFVLGQFHYITTPDPQYVSWCRDLAVTESCAIQVLGAIDSDIEVVVIDGDSEYKFMSAELENVVIVSQNGLNPLKEYPVEVRYTDLRGNEVVHTRQILGEELVR